MLSVMLNLLLTLPHASDWKYVTPPVKEVFHHPALRLLTLSNSKPEDLEEKANYRGTSRRYGQFHYGNAQSTRVTVVLDDRGNGLFDFYIDTRRRRVIHNEDRQADNATSWEIALDAVFSEGALSTPYPRRVLFQYGKTTRTLSYATCGYMEGAVQVDDETLKARRVDADANGLFADPQDRLWINLEGYDRWDPVAHQFPFAPVVTLRQQRYIVQADAIGERLQLKPLEGVGKLSIAVPKLRPGVSVVSLHAILTSKDGIMASFNAMDKEQTLPVGEYACTSLHLALKDGEKIWSYLFTIVDQERLIWTSLKKNEKKSIDVLGEPLLSVGLNDDDSTTAGENMIVQPILRTGQGLVVSTVYYGVDQPVFTTVDRAIIECRSNEKPFASTTSGFA